MKMNAAPSQVSVKMATVSTLLEVTGVNAMMVSSQVHLELNALASKPTVHYFLFK